MKNCRDIQLWAGFAGEAAVFNTDDAKLAGSYQDEHLFDVFMPPFLQCTFEDRVVVNSENFPRIGTLGASKKPYFFIGHMGVYERRQPDGDSTRSLELQREREER